MERASLKLFQIVIASKNMHKIRELKSILIKLLPNIDVLSLLDFPSYIPKEEVENSFEGNAIAKAVDAAKELNCWVLADDSGLVVPALNGEPGIFSARYAGKNASDKENRKKLLSKLENIKEENRNAFFKCCIAIASPEGLKKSACASVEGTILKEERGGDGFGYDPLFMKHDYNKTFAELSDSIKNKISHRRKAIDKILHVLESVSK